MKLNLKNIVLPILSLFIYLLSALKIGAAEFIDYNNYPPIITLCDYELSILRSYGNSINTSDNRFTITNIGHPKHTDMPALAECHLSQIDFRRPRPYAWVQDFTEGASLMSVTLSGNIYGSTSLPHIWTCISVHDNQTNHTSLFKVCESLDSPTSTPTAASVMSLFRN